MNNRPLHTFHIPVMGIAFTIDTPIRVAQYGISSVISIIDDDIIEKMRKFHSQRFDLDFSAIPTKTNDHRAKRITAYLNLVATIVDRKFKAFKEELIDKRQSLMDFIQLLPHTSTIRPELQKFLLAKADRSVLADYLDRHLSPGDIDVNIMTKVDKGNYEGDRQLPAIYNDAHASLRGFAESRLNSSVVLSAGMNPRLYSYIEQFEDFYPDVNGQLAKKIILKVSDFRSAMVQGQFLAKKGLWVSEYRIESGLNCGGHAFATEGFLLGPILEEFKQRRSELVANAHHMMIAALHRRSRPCPSQPLELRITVQGGVGTSEEHQFLLSYYNIDSVGWGSPFLLVPEATSVDPETRQLLANAEKDDYFLSDLSPLGIRFNTVKGTSNETVRRTKKENDRFGSSCPKKFLSLNKEFSSEGLCTASTKYQTLKLEQLDREQAAFQTGHLQTTEEKVTEKACLCVGLANSAYIENQIEVKGEDQGVVICPGPNLAYFNKEISLSQMVKHIYGSGNILSGSYRPNMFINEIKMYVDYLKNGLSTSVQDMTVAQQKKWENFRQNILNGIQYYQDLFIHPSFPQNEILSNRNDLTDLRWSLMS